MHALSSCFISAACFSAFIAVPTNTENFKFFLTLVCVLFLVGMQSYSYACTIESMLHRQDNSMAIIWGGLSLRIKCDLLIITLCISLVITN